MAHQCRCELGVLCERLGLNVTPAVRRGCASGAILPLAQRIAWAAGAERQRAGAPPKPERRAEPSCAYLGPEVLDPATGRTALRACATCSGSVRLKVLACAHPAHANDPTTTTLACRACPDFAKRAQP